MMISRNTVRYFFPVVILLEMAVFFSSCGGGQGKTEVNNTAVTVPEKDSVRVMTIDTTDPKYKAHPYLLAYDRALLLWGVPVEEKDIDTKYGKAHVIMCGPA